MRVCIHRGTKEIGGTCIEVEASGKRCPGINALDATGYTESALPAKIVAVRRAWRITGWHEEEG